MFQFIRLVSMRACVAELLATPELILLAAQKLGIPVFDHHDTKFILPSHLPTLKDELSGQPPSIPDQVTVGEFGRMMGVSCAMVDYWIKNRRILAQVHPNDKRIDRGEMQKITRPEAPENYVSLSLAAQMMGITAQVAQARVKQRNLAWKWFGRSGYIHCDDLDQLAKPGRKISPSPKEIVIEKSALYPHYLQDPGPLKNASIHNLAGWKIKLITRKTMTIRLLNMTACVISLTASPTAILAAARSAGIQMYVGNDIVFYNQMDIPALAAVLDNQPPSLPEMVSVSEFAVILGVTPSTVGRWIKEKRIESARINGVTQIAPGEITKVLQSDMPKGYVDIQTIAHRLATSERAVRARLLSRNIRPIICGNKLYISEKNSNRLARIDIQGPPIPGFACIKDAAQSLGITLAELRKAILKGQIQATIVNDQEGIPSYQLSEQQIDHARQFFSPNAAPPGQIALHLGVSKKTVREMVRKGLLAIIPVGRDKRITRQSFELFLAHKAGLTPQEAAKRLGCRLVEIDALVEEGILHYLDPTLPVLLDKVSLERYRSANPLRPLHQAAKEMGMLDHHVLYLLRTKRIAGYKIRGLIRIPIEQIQMLKEAYMDANMTIEATARFLGTSPVYIRSLVNAKKLASISLGRIVLINKSSVAAYQKRVQESAPLSYAETARRLGVTAGKVKHLIRCGRLRITLKRRLITPQAVADYLADKAASPYCTVAEAAAELGIKPSQVYNLIDQRQIEAHVNRNEYQVLRTSIDKFRARGK